MRVAGETLDARQIEARYGRLYGSAAGSGSEAYLHAVWEFPLQQLIDTPTATPSWKGSTAQ